MDKVKTLLLALVATLAPIQAALLTTFCLIFVDLVLGLMSAKKRKQDVTSSKLKATVVKLLAYESSIIMAYFVGTYLTGPDVPVLSMVTSIVGLTELKSCVEHIDTLTNKKLMSGILASLSSGSKTPKDE